MALADAPVRPSPLAHPIPAPHSRSPHEDTSYILGPMRGATATGETVFIVSVTVGAERYCVRVAFQATMSLDDPADPLGGQADVWAEPLPALGAASNGSAQDAIVAVLQAAQAVLQVRYEYERAIGRHPGWVRLWEQAAERLERYRQDYMAASEEDATA